MLPAICPKYSPHLAHMREIAASGLKNIFAFAEEMKAEIDTLPDDLKPMAEALTEITMQALIESYAEYLKLISELGLQEITQAALSNQRNTPSFGCRSHQEASENNWRE